MEVRRNLTYVVMIGIGLANIINIFFKELPEISIISLLNVILPSTYIVVDVLDRRSSNKELRDVKVSVDKTQDDVKEIKESVTNTETLVKELKPKREIKYVKSQLISGLINENIISLETVKSIIPKDKRFVSVLVYSKGASKNRPVAYKEKRLYPKIFKELGFVQLAGVWGFFIIAEENIYPKKLRGLNKLADYLLKAGKLSIIEEWNNIMAFAKKETPIFYRNRKGKDNPLHFNLLIMKTDLNNIRHSYTRNDFNELFNRELASVAKVNKIKLESEEYTALKSFVFQSSLNILVLGIPIRDRKKLLTLEKQFRKPASKGGLEIKNFYDYHKRNKEDISRIIKSGFKDDETSEKYTDMIIERSKRYEKELRVFGINV